MVSREESNRIFAETFQIKVLGRRNKNLPFYEKVIITDIGAEGKAIARHDGMVFFTTHVIPGDVVDLQVTKRRTKYQEAKVVKIHE